jgi:hypothetical protein
MELYLTRFRTDSKEDGVIFKTIVCNDMQDAHMKLDLQGYDRVELIEHMLLTKQSPYYVECYEVENEDMLNKVYMKYRTAVHEKYNGFGYCPYDIFLDYYEIDL